ncbi:MAG: OmpA family protein [Gemmatimonadota bacterium]
MAERPAPRLQDEAPSSSRDPDRDDGIASLRAILVGPEQRRMAALLARLDDPEQRAEDIGEVLPQVLMQHAHDPDFARALTPTLEKAITASVQRNPKPMADALFPVMGPAIRKAVAAGLAGMVESLNRTLELALSRRSIQWRIEALRTGKSFAEIVLLKTLLYRVEQVFLIDRKTGLLLQHVQADIDVVRDADMVSGMLTAIRDFVQDSFEVSDHASLDALEFGDLHLWIEPGPHAIVAAVIRGNAPLDYRRTLQDAVETIHLQFGETLASFSGDASILDGSRPMLEACLQTQFRAEERKPQKRGAWIVFGLFAAAILLWIGASYRANARWGRYIETLRTQPGLTVVSAEREGGRFVVTGLRDPLAVDPAPLVAAAGLSNDDVLGRWTPYQALDSQIVLARSRDILRPPPSVTLALNDGVLSTTGEAPTAWIAEARKVAPLIAGVRRFDAGQAVGAELRAAIAALEQETLHFVKGAPRLAAGQDDAMRRLVANFRQLGTLAEAAGLRFRVEIVGHTDEDGLPEANLPLSRSRAEVVRATLAPSSTAALELAVNGVGSTQPAVQGRSESEKQRNRRVTIRVTPMG